jgi:hypothetical protein
LIGVGTPRHITGLDLTRLVHNVAEPVYFRKFKIVLNAVERDSLGPAGSFQLAIMKMLSSYRGGKAPVAELKRDLAILATIVTATDGGSRLLAAHF